MPEQIPLFYEDIMDAINRMVNANPNGLSMKQIAMDLWPACNPDTARSLLSRAITPESHDHNLNPEELNKVMEISGAPEHVIFYFCDKFGFERPRVKAPDSFEKDIKADLKTMTQMMKALVQKVDVMEKKK